MKNLNYDLGDNIVNIQPNSINSKTGNAVQTYFIPKIMIEQGSFNVNNDSSVCFDCPLSKGNGCYVAKGFSRMGLNSKIKSLNKNGVTYNTSDDITVAIRNKYVRFGSYGEPVLFPLDMTKTMAYNASTWTGYTHQWRNPEYNAYKEFFMASVSTIEEAMLAVSMGWRYFLVIDKEESFPENVDIVGNKLYIDGKISAINCPASKESGRLTTCNTCGLCKGTASKARNIWIYKH